MKRHRCDTKVFNTFNAKRPRTDTNNEFDVIKADVPVITRTSSNSNHEMVVIDGHTRECNLQELYKLFTNTTLNDFDINNCLFGNVPLVINKQAIDQWLSFDILTKLCKSFESKLPAMLAANEANISNASNAGSRELRFETKRMRVEYAEYQIYNHLLMYYMLNYSAYATEPVTKSQKVIAHTCAATKHLFESKINANQYLTHTLLELIRFKFVIERDLPSVDMIRIEI